MLLNRPAPATRTRLGGASMISAKVTIRWNDEDVEIQINDHLSRPTSDKIWDVVNQATAKAIAAMRANHL